MSREVVLARRPEGAPQESDFEVRDAPEVTPADGNVLIPNV
jgi:NADPH-dependent curcumin reductase CurA